MELTEKKLRNNIVVLFFYMIINEIVYKLISVNLAHKSLETPFLYHAFMLVFRYAIIIIMLYFIQKYVREKMSNY